MLLDWVWRTHGLSYRREAIDQWDPFIALGLPSSEWRRLADAVGPLELCRKMAPLPGAAAFLVALEAVAEVKVATTPMNPAWMTQRAEWLEEHMGIPLARQIHLHDKEDLVLAWDVLIDDKVENCVAFAEAGGMAFCLAAPYNAHCPAEIRRGGYGECLDWLASMA